MNGPIQVGPGSDDYGRDRAPNEMDPQVQIRILEKGLAEAEEMVRQMTGNAKTNNSSCWASALMAACGIEDEFTGSSAEGWKRVHPEIHEKVKQIVECMSAFTVQCVLENQRMTRAVEIVHDFLGGDET